MNEKLLEKVLDKLLFNDNWNNQEVEGNNILWSENIGKYVILRWYDSGVHFGKLVFAKKWLYRLEESRRLWRWWAKQWIWLTSVAMYGLAERDEVKICVEIPKIEITDDRICEIIPCTDDIVTQIKSYKEYDPS